MTDQMNNGQPNEEPEHIRDLRAKADNATKLERENAMLRAGVDLDTPIGGMFAKAYDGDMSPEAVKAAFAEVYTPPPTTTPPPTSDGPTPEQAAAEAEQARLQAEQDAARRPIGSTPAEPHNPGTQDPVIAAYDQFHADRKRGLTAQKASAGVFGTIMAEAAQGNEKYLATPWTADELAGDAVR